MNPNTFIDLDIPCFAHEVNGTTVWDNRITGTHYMCNITLQDLVTFQHYEYEILSGVIYHERQYNIRDVINKQFQLRV